MEVSMRAAALSALLSVAVGAMLGVFYDVIRLSRVLFGISVASPFGTRSLRRYVSYLLCALGDLLFFAVAAVVMAVFFFLRSNGIVRGYALLGAFCGFLLYYNTVGRLLIGTFEAVAAFVRRTLRRIFTKIYGVCSKKVRAFLGAPIVLRLAAWYNKRKTVARCAADEKKRKRKMAKGGCIRNG